MKHKRIWIAVFLFFVCFLAICRMPHIPAHNLQKKPVITIYSDDVENMTDFWTRLSSRFSNIKIKVIIHNNENPAEQMKRLIEHGDIPDIIFSEYLSKNIKNLSENLLDLSGKSYISHFQTTYLNDLNINGKIYYIPAQLTAQGLVYNRTLFQARGWKVPKSYKQFISLCKKINSEGIRSVLFTNGPHAPADYFYQFYMLNKGYKISSKQWLNEFNNRQASVYEENFKQTFDDLNTLKQLGAISKNDLQISRNTVFYSLHAEQKLAMLEGNSVHTNRMRNRSCSDEFRFMPYYSSGNDKGYLFLQPLMNVAVGKQVEKDPDKMALVDQILNYISSEKGQKDLAEINKSMFSPTLGMIDIDDTDFYADVQKQMEQSMFLKLPSFAHCDSVLNQSMSLFLKGEMTSEQVLDSIETANRTSEEMDAPDKTVLALAQKDFTVEETNRLVLKAMKTVLKTDLAILSKSDRNIKIENQSLNGKLYKGQITKTDIECISPVRGEDGEEIMLDKVIFTGEELLNLLEYNAPYYYYGITVDYTYDKKAGLYRATGLKDSNGQKLDVKKEYSAALLKQSTLHPSYYTKRSNTDIKFYTMLEDYLIRFKKF